MQNDCFGLAIPAASREAVDHYDEAVRAYLGFRTDTGGHLKQALAADAGLFMGHCIRGYFSPCRRWSRKRWMPPTKRANW